MTHLYAQLARHRKGKYSRRRGGGEGEVVEVVEVVDEEEEEEVEESGGKVDQSESLAAVADHWLERRLRQSGGGRGHQLLASLLLLPEWSTRGLQSCDQFETV